MGPCPRPPCSGLRAILRSRSLPSVSWPSKAIISSSGSAGWKGFSSDIHSSTVSEFILWKPHASMGFRVRKRPVSMRLEMERHDSLGHQRPLQAKERILQELRASMGLRAQERLLRLLEMNDHNALKNQSLLNIPAAIFKCRSVPESEEFVVVGVGILEVPKHRGAKSGGDEASFEHCLCSDMGRIYADNFEIGRALNHCASALALNERDWHCRYWLFRDYHHTSQFRHLRVEYSHASCINITLAPFIL